MAVCAVRLLGFHARTARCYGGCSHKEARRIRKRHWRAVILEHMQLPLAARDRLKSSPVDIFPLAMGPWNGQQLGTWLCLVEEPLPSVGKAGRQPQR